jgi:hypothetical protein
LVLMALTRRDELSLTFGVTALLLAIVAGVVSWRERLGKTVVIATLVLFTGLGITVAILSEVIPWPTAKRAQQQARIEEEQARRRVQDAELNQATTRLGELRKQFTDEHPLVKAALAQIQELEQKVRQAPDWAATEIWSPSLGQGEKPDPAKILQEASALAAEGRFAEALQRHIWYHNHALEYAASQSAVRLSFALSAWIELGRKYPQAKQALVEIRDRKTREIAAGQGYFAMFHEVASINHYLQDEDATCALFKTVQKLDPALATQCYFVAEDQLVKKGEYELCLKSIGDTQAWSDRLRREVDMYDELARKNPALDRPESRSHSTRHFVEKTCQLIEILVATGHKADAEKIREQAATFNNDPRLKTAVQDALKKLGQ